MTILLWRLPEHERNCIILIIALLALIALDIDAEMSEEEREEEEREREHRRRQRGKKRRRYSTPSMDFDSPFATEPIRQPDFKRFGVNLISVSRADPSKPALSPISNRHRPPIKVSIELA
ncbi:hypothetical protein BO94DRAFT_545675 [Aspergillus sclerotioniger CBS 115572]|uniref:Uncharacterized protein n=1 Tax=Aspergillus sclerotioniger CBS 115572 TaxID=1450535 RepID=A0A317WQ62_9EURO|nr:hypothetical protein BO94DRAFT_545675 [Aspergillus sclerotioniger CBS 115572]PWY88563.1 hypothetical protein BO94DRAFT_545675 [Aspergillus sclerotioniger CBS 115572]